MFVIYGDTFFAKKKRKKTKTKKQQHKLCFYVNVPHIVRHFRIEFSISLLMPKSVSLAIPFEVTQILAGFKSLKKKEKEQTKMLKSYKLFTR